MRMLFCIGLFDTDPIITGGTGGETKPQPPSPSPCVEPGPGSPPYDAVVLNALYGDGYISHANYKAVMAGTLSIEDLGLKDEQLQRLRCSEPGNPPGYDIHFDPTFPPEITDTIPGRGVFFSPQHKPTDKARRITVTVVKGGALAAGGKVCRVNFGSEYVQEHRVSVAPLVLATGVGGSQTWRAANITPTGYDLYSDSGVAVGESANLQVLVEPARR